MNTLRFKQKEFRRDTPRKWNIDSGKNVAIKVEATKLYEYDINKITMTSYKSRVKQLVSDIRKGYIYSDGPHGGDTHYLSDFSHRDTLMYSKAVTKGLIKADRLNYIIYKPYEYNDILVFKVALQRCEGHHLNTGKNVNYIEASRLFSSTGDELRKLWKGKHKFVNPDTGEIDELIFGDGIRTGNAYMLSPDEVESLGLLGDGLKRRVFSTEYYDPIENWNLVSEDELDELMN